MCTPTQQVHPRCGLGQRKTWRGGGVPREEVPMEGAPGEALEALLGKPWGRC